jgi:hypothetical protein
MSMFCKKCGKEVPYGMVLCEKCATGKASETEYKAPPTVFQPGTPSRFDSQTQTPPYQTYSPPQSRYTQPTINTGTSSLAIASLVVSILAVIIWPLALIAGPVALVLGIVGKNQIRSSGGMQQGGGLATAGIIISSISLGILVLAALLFPLLQRARIRARQQYYPGTRIDKLNTTPISMDYNMTIHNTINWSDMMRTNA